MSKSLCKIIKFFLNLRKHIKPQLMKKLLLSLSLTAVLTMSGQTTIFEENWDGTGPGIEGDQLSARP